MNAPFAPRTNMVRVADLGDAIERARIGAFVHEQPQGTPFHLPAWTIATARGTGQRAHFLIAEKPDSSIAGVLPLTEIHSPLFGRALVSAGFGVGGGVLAEAQAVEPLARAAWNLAERLSCPTLELRGGPAPEGFATDEASYLGFVRPLADNDEAELTAIPRKQRAEVRRSLGFDLEIVVGCNADDAATHYAVYAESVRNLCTPVFPARLFREVVKEFGNSADILLVRERGVALAGVLSLYWNGTVYPYWGGGTLAARARRANDRMYFELMRHARTRGCTRFDFGRSKTGTGAAAFKKNWGFEGEPLAYHVRTASGAAPRSVNPLSPRYRLQVAAWKRLPLGIANRLGPWIAKGLG